MLLIKVIIGVVIGVGFLFSLGLALWVRRGANKISKSVGNEMVRQARAAIKATVGGRND